MLRFLFFLYFVFVVLFVQAQEKLQFENYSTENGLCQNSGYAIAQTKEGILWFGTQDGLNSYDGTRFAKYKRDDETNKSLTNLPSNNIQALVADSNNLLWIGTPNGICIFDVNKNLFFKPSQLFNTDVKVDDYNIRKLFIDSKHNIWIITMYKGLYFFSYNEKKLVQISSNGLQDDAITGIAEGENVGVWVCCKNEIFNYNNNKLTPYNLFQKLKLIPESINVRDIEIIDGKIWLGTFKNGLIRIENIFSNPVKTNITVESKQITSNEITNLKKDKAKNLWIGTRSGGINKIDASTNNLSVGNYVTSDKYSLRKNLVLSIFQDAQGIVWIGTSGGGFNKYDVNRFQFGIIKNTFQNDTKAADNMIMGMAVLPNNQLAYGLIYGGMSIFNRNNGQQVNYQSSSLSNALLHNNVYGFASENNNLWLATWGGLCKYNLESKSFVSFKNLLNVTNLYSIVKFQNAPILLLSGNYGLFEFNITTNTVKQVKANLNSKIDSIIVARVMYETSNGTFFLGTENNGLCVYNSNTGQITQSKSVFPINSTIRCIISDGDFYWLGGDNGLVQYSLVNDVVINHYTKKTGLSDNVIYGIQKDDNGNLWLSTNNGICFFDYNNNVYKNYDIGYGLQAMEFNTNSSAKDSLGNIFFGGIDGINFFNPNDLKLSNKYAPKVLITDIKVMNKHYSLNKAAWVVSDINLNYDNNFIQINFSLPNFSHNEKNTYRYKLSAVDADWVYCGTKTEANYTDLSPGTYEFFVQGCNSDNIWSEEITKLVINIKPPFWKTWWFLLLCVLAAGSLIYLLIKNRVKRIKHKATIDKQLADYEMKALHTQMNPHFIFNSLGSIKSMILDDKKENASKYLSKFAKMIRLTLNHSTESFISLQQNNEYIKYYLEIEQLRFNNIFSFKIDIDSSLNEGEVKMPAMMIQPLVENAIWHGLLKSDGEKQLLIRYYQQDAKLYCEVDDNGIGINAAKKLINEKHNSVALNNIEMRLTLLNEKFKLNCSLNIVDKSNLNLNETGTIATITLPFINTDL